MKNLRHLVSNIDGTLLVLMKYLGVPKVDSKSTAKDVYADYGFKHMIKPALADDSRSKNYVIHLLEWASKADAQNPAILAQAKRKKAQEKRAEAEQVLQSVIGDVPEQMRPMPDWPDKLTDVAMRLVSSMSQGKTDQELAQLDAALEKIHNAQQKGKKWQQLNREADSLEEEAEKWNKQAKSLTELIRDLKNLPAEVGKVMAEQDEEQKENKIHRAKNSPSKDANS